MSETKQQYTTNEVVALTNFSNSKIRRLVKSGEFPSPKRLPLNKLKNYYDLNLVDNQIEENLKGNKHEI